MDTTNLGYYANINIASTTQVIKNTRAYSLSYKPYTFLPLQQKDKQGRKTFQNIYEP